MARSLSAPFVECSAAEGVNVDVAFRELVRLVRKDERVGGPSRGVEANRAEVYGGCAENPCRVRDATHISRGANGRV